MQFRYKTSNNREQSMTTQPANMKPNGPDEITSLVIVKTILEHRLDDLLEMANQADNEGRPMAAEISYFAHEQLREAASLVQASIDNDFDAMNNAFTEVTEVDDNLRKDESILLHDKLQDALSALCPDNPSLARLVFLTSVKMIEDAKSGGLRLSAYP